jgi:hypothetical protein
LGELALKGIAHPVKAFNITAFNAGLDGTAATPDV